MAPSSPLLIVCLVSGCDLAFGLTGEPEPCELGSFEQATATDIAEAEEFSIDWDQKLVVLTARGEPYELALPGGTPTLIDLGGYSTVSLSLTPEGDALFYTAVVEPMLLKGALRASATWSLGAGIPRGTFAGTPSADAFGPRRVLVKMRDVGDDVQEYEDVNGRWTAIGEVHPINTFFVPNLTPNGLTMVYPSFDASGEPAVLAATRNTPDEWFGVPQVILPGPYHSAQLLGQCQQLYAGDGQTLRRYDR